LILDEPLPDDSLVAECAWQAGVRLGTWQAHAGMQFEIYEFASPAPLAGLNFYRSLAGQSYSYSKVLLYGIAHIFGETFESKVANFLSKLKMSFFDYRFGMWCSEFVANFFIDYPGILDLSGVNLENVTPEDLYQLVKSSDKFVLSSSSK